MKFRPGNFGRPPAHGVALPSGERQIVCSFDDETFTEIRTLANLARISFRAQVRLLVEFGLEDLKDQDPDASPTPPNHRTRT